MKRNSTEALKMELKAVLSVGDVVLIDGSIDHTPVEQLPRDGRDRALVFHRTCWNRELEVDRALKAAEPRDFPNVYYVGMADTLDRDLFGWPVRQLSGWRLRGGERIYELLWPLPRKEPIYAEEGYLYTYARIIEGDRESWMAVVGDRFTNFPGGCAIGGNPVLYTRRAESKDELDWRGTYLDNPDGEYGWLSPTGTWYGCKHMEHDAVARFVVKRSVRKLEEAGWVRVDGPPGDSVLEWRQERGRLTAEQRNWLLLRGYRTEEVAHGNLVAPGRRS